MSDCEEIQCKSPASARFKVARGYLEKIESRAIGGNVRKKYWFALSQDTPHLFWFKSKSDMVPLGKVLLSGSTFNFDFGSNGFEIRVSEKEVHHMVAHSANSRDQWLQSLQDCRMKHYMPQSATANLSVAECNLIDLDASRTSDNDDLMSFQSANDELVIGDEEQEGEEKTTNEAATEDLSNTDIESSKFYLTQSGKLTDESLVTPNSVSPPPGADFIRDIRRWSMRSLAQLTESQSLGDPSQNTQNFKGKDVPQPLPADTLPSGSGFDQANNPCKESSNQGAVPRSQSFLSRSPLKKNPIKLRLPAILNKSAKSCSGCQELISVVHQMQERYSDVTDESNANRELVAILKENIASTKSQMQSMKELGSLGSFEEQMEYFLQKESLLFNVQSQNAELKKSLEDEKERVNQLENDLQIAQQDMEAYKECLRSKEKVIMSLIEKSNQEIENDPPDGADNNKLEMGIDIVGDSLDPSGAGKEASALISIPDEHEVEDIMQFKDAANAYQKQNQFLNREIIELQNVIKSLEKNNKLLVRKNFDLEAMYYQLKAKYVLMLNHMKPTSGMGNSMGLDAAQLKDMIFDATRSPQNIHSTNPQFLNPSNNGNDSNPPSSSSPNSNPSSLFYPSGKVSGVSGVGSGSRTMKTDCLGFYVNDIGVPNKNVRQKTLVTPDDLDLVSTAAELDQKSQLIKSKNDEESKEEHVKWLERWDSAVVALSTDKLITPSTEFKALLRTSIPHNYRARLWRCLVERSVRDTMDELGKGYFNSLIRKSIARRQAENDPLLKQIDLDLSRTLPGNKYFEEPESGKMNQLQRVLYAFRWHNPTIGYCQGLNRIVAVALLYLGETDAFWFLVSIVEHQQPADYYTPKLLTAVADQRVLADLVADKLSKISNHLKLLDTDLNMFTLSWFLTIFVDSLPHQVYLPIFDVLLLEGNKVLFRFALAALKLSEQRILNCKTAGAVQSCLSKLGDTISDYKKLSHVAFNELSHFPMKMIESRRQYHLNQLKSEL